MSAFFFHDLADFFGGEFVGVGFGEKTVDLLLDVCQLGVAEAAEDI